MNAPERLPPSAATADPVPAHPPREAALQPAPRSGAATVVLATLGVIGALWWGQRFLVPVVAGLMLALMLGPAVTRLQRVLRWRPLGAGISLLAFLAVIGAAGIVFGGQLARVTERIPEMITLAAQRVAENKPAKDSVLAQARLALRDLDRATSRALGLQPDRPLTVSSRATPTEPPLSERATIVLRDTAFSGSGMLLKFVSDLTIVLFTAFFVLSSGALLNERFLDQWGHRPEARLRAERAFHECGRQVRLYAAVLLFTNALIGVAVWLAFAAAGLPDAGGWGVTAAVLHVVPYLGMALLTGLAGAEAFLAHGTWGAMLGMAAFVVALSTVVGTVVTAWLQGRAAKMNPTTVFIGLVFWGALWGVWGLFLGPLLIVLIKVVAENSRSGHRLARLMQG